MNFVCETCDVPFSVSSSYAKRISGKYCSHQCAAARLKKRNMQKCAGCGADFEAVATKARKFCSKQCVSQSRRIAGAKWRDPAQIKLYMKAYAQKNRAKLSEQSRLWCAENSETRRLSAANYAHRSRVSGRADAAREAAKLDKGAATPSDLRRLFVRADGRCVYCSSKPRSLTIDHYVPIASGGKHKVSNLVPACKPCNSSKGAREPEEWIETRRGIQGLARVHVFLSKKSDASTKRLMRALHGIEVEVVR